jgi:O-6-methylguanine DNA methyltransferase
VPEQLLERMTGVSFGRGGEYNLRVYRRRYRSGQSRWAPPKLSPAAVVSLHTPLGELFVGASDRGVVACGFGDRHFLEELIGAGYEAVIHGAPQDATAHAASARDQLGEYFSGSLRTFTIPIEFGNQTEFGRAVLSEVASRVPFGETRTYGEIGELAGRTRAARAVGNILATCSFTVIVPCHRIVHSTRTPDERLVDINDRRHRKAWLLWFEESSAS